MNLSGEEAEQVVGDGHDEQETEAEIVENKPVPEKWEIQRNSQEEIQHEEYALARHNVEKR